MKHLEGDGFPLRYLTYFIIAAIIISVAGYLFYLDRKSVIEEELSRHIIAIKEIKLQQIESEQRQRKKTIESFLNIPSVKREFIRLFTYRYNRNAVQEIEKLTQELMTNLNFSSLNVFNNKADVLITTDSLYNINQNFLKHELSVLLANDSSLITNMYMGDNKNLIQALVVPVIHKDSALGYIWAEYSFFEYLHPIVDYTKSEPGNVEFVLIKSDGDLAFVIRDIGTGDINSIRTIPLNTADRQSLRSVPSGRELARGIEFRGKRIYASAINIAGTDWNLITKIDEELIIRSLQRTALVISIIAVLLIILSASITYAIWKRSRLHFLSRTFMLKREKDLITERYSSITRYANDMIFSVDSTGKIVEANQRAVDIYGYSRDELLNMKFTDLSSNSDEYKFRVESGDGVVYETIHNRKDGSPVPVEISAKYVTQDDEKYLLAIVRDYTERKRLQAELISAKEKAEENDRLKTIILSNMSHELNTPMSGIIGFSEILSSELEDKSQKEMASLINKSGRRLNDTLNSILDLSNLESRNLQFNYEKIEINTFITEYTKNIESDALEKGLKFSLELFSGNIFINTDPNILAKIVKYITSNAVKYTSEGKVSVITNTMNGMAEIRIADTGIGISKEHLELIFEPFRQVSEGSNRNFEGTGIGLTITKKLVELLKGTIKIESNPGTGTTVILHFPLK